MLGARGGSNDHSLNLSMLRNPADAIPDNLGNFFYPHKAEF